MGRVAIAQHGPGDVAGCAMVGGRPVSGLRVDGQWSMVIATRSRSMGSEAREGMVRGRANSMLQGHRLARWIARLRLGHPDRRAVVTRPTLYRAVASITSLCIRDADLI